jgi:hypothetical protein
MLLDYHIRTESQKQKESTYDSDDQSVLRCVVFVFVLNDHSLSRIVVGLAFASSSKFDLITLAVCFGFDYFDEWHCKLKRMRMPEPKSDSLARAIHKTDKRS